MLKAFRQQLESAHVEPMMNNEDEEDTEEDQVLDNQNDENDFEVQELEHLTTFCNCLSCFAHTLQLVVKRFSDDQSFCDLLTRVQKLVKRVNKSS